MERSRELHPLKPPTQMKIRSLLLVCVCVSGCRAAEPDYWELSPFFAGTDGSGRYAGQQVMGSEAEVAGVMLTVGWAVGSMGRAFDNLERLDISQGGELTLRDGGGDVDVTVEQGGQEAEEAESDLIDDVKRATPTTLEEMVGLIVLAVVSLIALPMVIAARKNLKAAKSDDE